VNLSPHFTLEEATFSSTALRFGISNEPSLEQMQGARRAAIGMEAVRSELGDFPIHVDSWIRSPALNDKVRGSPRSAHMGGFAVDFICSKFGTPFAITQRLAKSGIKFDQLIQEGNWVHISFAPALRQELLTAHFDSRGKVSYTTGIQIS